MAQQEEIVLWIDQRWKNAIEKHLKDETLQEHLENVLDELCNRLPEREYERISRAIQSEAAAQRAEEEAARTYAAYHVTEHGQEWYFKTSPGEELLAVGKKLRSYITSEKVTVPDLFMPPFDVLPLFSAGRSRRLTLVPIIQSLAQLEKNYGKEGSEIIQDNCQDTIFGGFAPNSQTAEVLSKALGNRTVLSGSVSRGNNDPSQSLQMMERPLLTPDELKSIPKGNFIVQKTGQHPMRTRLRLFLEWGITFEEPYIVPERADRAVAYANREDLERNLPQSNKAENADMRGAYAVSGRGGIAHEPAVDKPRRRGGKQMKTYGEEDL